MRTSRLPCPRFGASSTRWRFVQSSWHASARGFDCWAEPFVVESVVTMAAASSRRWRPSLSGCRCTTRNAGPSCFECRRASARFSQSHLSAAGPSMSKSLRGWPLAPNTWRHSAAILALADERRVNATAPAPATRCRLLARAEYHASRIAAVSEVDFRETRNKASLGVRPGRSVQGCCQALPAMSGA